MIHLAKRAFGSAFHCRVNIDSYLHVATMSRHAATERQRDAADTFDDVMRQSVFVLCPEGRVRSHARHIC